MDTDVTDPAETPDPAHVTEPAGPGDPGAGRPSAGDWLRGLRRSSTERLVGGVCGGLALDLGLPVLLVRAAVALLAVLGVGVPLYAIAWVLVPTDRGDRLLGRGPFRDLLAVGVLVVATLFLLDRAAQVSFPHVLSRALPGS
ncbi:MAG: PspC domain-containing protein [Acidimicrobiales bacterium]